MLNWKGEGEQKQTIMAKGLCVTSEKCTWPDFNISPFPLLFLCFLAFPHSSSSSSPLISIPFFVFLTWAKVGNACWGKQEHTRMADIRRVQQTRFPEVNMVLHFSQLNTISFPCVCSFCCISHTVRSCPLTSFSISEILMEVQQVGKDCHTNVTSFRGDVVSWRWKQWQQWQCHTAIPWRGKWLTYHSRPVETLKYVSFTCSCRADLMMWFTTVSGRRWPCWSRCRNMQRVLSFTAPLGETYERHWRYDVSSTH